MADKISVGAYWARNKVEKEWTTICVVTGEEPFFRRTLLNVSSNVIANNAELIIGPKVEIPLVKEN